MKIQKIEELSFPRSVIKRDGKYHSEVVNTQELLNEINDQFERSVEIMKSLRSILLSRSHISVAEQSLLRKTEKYLGMENVSYETR